MKSIIHIGAQKTGTTTIQAFLSRNREELKKKGYFYPYEDFNIAKSRGLQYTVASDLCASYRVHCLLGAGEIFSYSKDNVPRMDSDVQRDKYKCDIEANCRKDGCVIFSDENLSFLSADEVERLKKWLASLFDDITIIVYLRRQPEYLVSFYNTLVQLGATRSILDYLEVFDEYGFLAFCKIIDNWSIFGKDKLNVRIFDKTELYNQNILSDFAHIAGINMVGLETVENQNVSLSSADVEFWRLLNAYISQVPDSPRPFIKKILRAKIKEASDEKAYYLNRFEAQRILDLYREGNDWIAREYLGREKLFDEDISMYPEEIVPHHLTLERSIEISAELMKGFATKVKLLETKVHDIRKICTERDTQIQGLQTEIKNRDTKIQGLQTELQSRDVEIQGLQSEIQRSHTNLALLRQKHSIYWHYYLYKVLAKITLGKKCKHYQEKRNAFHEKVRQIRNQCKSN